jgi:magnesium chelatase subunit H
MTPTAPAPAAPKGRKKDRTATRRARGSRSGVPFTVVTLDNHLVGALHRANERLGREGIDLDLRIHVAADWDAPSERERMDQDLEESPLVLVSQLFLQDHVDAVTPLLDAHADRHAARVCLMCHGDLTNRTLMGRFEPGAKKKWSPAGLMRRLRGRGKDGGDSGERQLRSLKRAGRILRFIPGSAQDVRVYLMALQAWLTGSDDNLTALLRTVALRYAPDSFPDHEVGPLPTLQDYPESGLYHPDLAGNGITDSTKGLPGPKRPRGTVGLLIMRSYVLAGNTAHYDAVIRALEARGLAVRAAFAAGLDTRPVLDRWFRKDDGSADIDALVSLSGFSLVGGPAWHDAERAREALASLDVPFVVAQPLEFQTVEAWEGDDRGLTPLETALMVSMPELDGAISPMVFGGRGGSASSGTPDAVPVQERIEHLAERLDRWITVRSTPRDDRKLAVVLFNFPPTAGNAGTAAYLDVFPSLFALMKRLADSGYDVDVPESAEALREMLVGEGARVMGTRARVHVRVPTDDHVSRETHLEEIEAAWGPAPGRHLSDGANILVLGAQFGNLFVGLQPGMGYEGDPMRLLFEKGFAPTHAFSGFYRWIREDFGAHAMVHFGTHGAAEFMPGKQVGLGPGCWPDRLLGDTPNLYLYAANNPSEGTLAKRRGNATLLSYLTPSLARAGLYKDLLALREELDRWSAQTGRGNRDDALLETIRARAEAMELDLPEGEPEPGHLVQSLREQLLELEYALIPTGLHVLGHAPGPDARCELLAAAAEAGFPEAEILPFDDLRGAALPPSRDALEPAVRAIEAGDTQQGEKQLAKAGLAAPDAHALALVLEDLRGRLLANPELDAVVHALDGRWIAPAPGGDVIRNPAVLPTGRNTYGFDPWRVPTAAAQREGQLQAERLLERLRKENGSWPETVALALWGTDNMKRDGAPLAQALALIGAEARFDTYGRLSGAQLIPLEELGRPRVDVLVTASGVFRDLLPLQLRLLADAAWLAASADEDPEQNAVRRHALAQQEALGCTLEEASRRVFSNADGAYGANVNQTVETGAWTDGDELAEVFVRRKGFAYGRDGRAAPAHDLFQMALGKVDAAYQNLDSVELGVSDVDQYVDALGGVTKAASRASGKDVPAYIGDETRGAGVVRSLQEQVSLESRTRTLNPRWYEAMLAHGYQGVREVEARVTTTLGWSATAEAVSPWVYQGIGETYVLDPEMRKRLAELNPDAAVRMAGRLLEACDRGFWTPDEETMAALQDAADELEDRLEGIDPEAAA